MELPVELWEQIFTYTSVRDPIKKMSIHITELFVIPAVCRLFHHITRQHRFNKMYKDRFIYYMNVLKQENNSKMEPGYYFTDYIDIQVGPDHDISDDWMSFYVVNRDFFRSHWSCLSVFLDFMCSILCLTEDTLSHSAFRQWLSLQTRLTLPELFALAKSGNHPKEVKNMHEGKRTIKVLLRNGHHAQAIKLWKEWNEIEPNTINICDMWTQGVQVYKKVGGATVSDFKEFVNACGLTAKKCRISLGSILDCSDERLCCELLSTILKGRRHLENLSLEQFARIAQISLVKNHHQVFSILCDRSTSRQKEWLLEARMSIYKSVLAEWRNRKYVVKNPQAEWLMLFKGLKLDCRTLYEDKSTSYLADFGFYASPDFLCDPIFSKRLSVSKEMDLLFGILSSNNKLLYKTYYETKLPERTAFDRAVKRVAKLLTGNDPWRYYVNFSSLTSETIGKRFGKALLKGHKLYEDFFGSGLTLFFNFIRHAAMPSNIFEKLLCAIYGSLGDMDLIDCHHRIIKSVLSNKSDPGTMLTSILCNDIARNDDQIFNEFIKAVGNAQLLKLYITSANEQIASIVDNYLYAAEDKIQEAYHIAKKFVRIFNALLYGGEPREKCCHSSDIIFRMRVLAEFFSTNFIDLLERICHTDVAACCGFEHFCKFMWCIEEVKGCLSQDTWNYIFYMATSHSSDPHKGPIYCWLKPGPSMLQLAAHKHGLKGECRFNVGLLAKHPDTLASCSNVERLKIIVRYNMLPLLEKECMDALSDVDKEDILFLCMKSFNLGKDRKKYAKEKFMQSLLDTMTAGQLQRTICKAICYFLSQVKKLHTKESLFANYAYSFVFMHCYKNLIDPFGVLKTVDKEKYDYLGSFLERRSIFNDFSPAYATRKRALDQAKKITTKKQKFINE